MSFDVTFRCGYSFFFPFNFLRLLMLPLRGKQALSENHKSDGFIRLVSFSLVVLGRKLCSSFTKYRNCFVIVVGTTNWRFRLLFSIIPKIVCILMLILLKMPPSINFYFLHGAHVLKLKTYYTYNTMLFN